jgi:SAM-dependent methyltransferase
MQQSLNTTTAIRATDKLERMSKRKRSKDGPEEAEDADATTSAETKVAEAGSSLAVQCEADKGHRYGNFHNYYHFHPPQERLDIISKNKGILDRIADRWKHLDNPPIFTLLDIGCNQGDLTMALARLIHSRLSVNNDSNICVNVTGMDIDPVLIERAMQQQQATDCQSIQPHFVTGDVLQPDCQLPEADMTTLFSTTMWLHIHGGDSGLSDALEKICKSTRYLVLIESQPSRCYKAAVTRLRRMNRPEVNVSDTRLKWRSNLEQRVDEVMSRFDFVRTRSVDDGAQVTSWDRSLWLYCKQSPST